MVPTNQVKCVVSVTVTGDVEVWNLQEFNPMQCVLHAPPTHAYDSRFLFISNVSKKIYGTCSIFMQALLSASISRIHSGITTKKSHDISNR